MAEPPFDPPLIWGETGGLSDTPKRESALVLRSAPPRLTNASIGTSHQALRLSPGGPKRAVPVSRAFLAIKRFCCTLLVLDGHVRRLGREIIIRRRRRSLSCRWR